MKTEFIVALHMERQEAMSESHTVRLGIYWAESFDQAFGMAAREHLRDGWKLGSRTGGKLEDLRIYYAERQES